MLNHLLSIKYRLSSKRVLKLPSIYIFNSKNFSIIEKNDILNTFRRIKNTKKSSSDEINLLLKNVLQNKREYNYLDVCEIIKAINLNDMNNESLTLIDNIIKSINHLITRQLLHSFQKIVFALGSKGIYDENIRQMFHFKIRTFS